MTEKDINRLWNKLDEISREITDIQKSVAVHGERLTEMPDRLKKEIKSEISGIQLRYIGYVIVGIVFPVVASAITYFLKG